MRADIIPEKCVFFERLIADDMQMFRGYILFATDF